MDMNIKGMDDVLVGRAKMAAMAGGVSLKVFVIDALNEKLDREARYDRTGVGDVGAGVAGSVGTKTKKSRGRGPNSKPFEPAKGTAAGDRGSNNGPVVGAQNPEIEPTLIPGEKCALCGAAVYEAPRSDSSGRKWKCVGPRTHTMTPREPKESK